MTPTEALDQLIDAGRATPEAQDALYGAGYLAWNAVLGWFVSTAKGREALARRKRERATSSPA